MVLLLEVSHRVTSEAIFFFLKWSMWLQSKPVSTNSCSEGCDSQTKIKEREHMGLDQQDYR